MTGTNRQSGFTLVELNLAIVFVAFLVLAVAMTTMSVTHTYRYGVSLKMINQLGREVSDQLRRDLMSASPTRALYVGTTDTTSGIGRLCLGNVSYIFNNAQLLSNGGLATTVKDSNSENITLVRVDDPERTWCTTSINQIPSDASYTEMLKADATPVAIHAMSLEKLIEADEDEERLAEGIIQVSFQLGTNETNTTDGGKCKPPTAPDQNFDNCAVRQFVVIARATGG